MRRRAAVVAVAVLGFLASGCRDTPDRSAASTSARPAASPTAPADREDADAARGGDGPACDRRGHPAGQSTEAFEFGGQIREFELYVPAGYDGTSEVALVFNFHGFGSNARLQMAYADFKPIADREGFLVVAPEGQGAIRHFNLGSEAGLQDDAAMSVALLDHLAAALCVDRTRVYSTGMSNGGAMTSVLACRHPGVFAAYAPVAVVLHLPGCAGDTPVPLAAFMGTADPVVPFDGGEVRCCGNPTIGAAPDYVAGWAAHNGCDPSFSEERIGSEVVVRTWTGCRPGGDVVFYVIDGGGHTWPGAVPIDGLGLTTQQIDASETIWEFFARHSRPG